MPRIVEPTPTNVAAAARRLHAGDVVAFPTETVYGLGADACNAAAVHRIFQLKGRPADNPVIVHVRNRADAQSLTTDFNDRATRLAERFWPGPLTLVLRRSAARVPDVVTAGYDTVALRCPAHPVAQALLEAFGGPIAAPSANRSGHVSPTRASHVAADFADTDDLLILDGGPCDVGIESTVLDVSGTVARILRPGSVTAEQIRGMIGCLNDSTIADQIHGPGTAASHYAPDTRCELIDHDALAHRLARSQSSMVVLCVDTTSVYAPHRAIAMPADAAAYAHRLYDALREADMLGCAAILIEQPGDDSPEWRAVRDRLRRATTPSAQK